MSLTKNILIKLVTFLAGLYFVLKFILPKDNFLVDFSLYHENIVYGFTVVGAMAVGLGLLNLLQSHGLKVIYKKRDWLFSFVLLVSLFSMIFVQSATWLASLTDSKTAAKFVTLSDFSKIILSDQQAQKDQTLGRSAREQMLIAAYRKAFEALQPEIQQHPEISTLAAEIEALFEDSTIDDNDHQLLQTKSFMLSNLVRAQLDQLRAKNTVSKINHVMNDGLFVALGAAMFALLGFYIAAAAYRAFRIKSVEAALMMCAALIVMLGQIPFGLWIYEDFPSLRLWLLQVPSAGAARAIEIGAAIAGLILAVRMWLSLDRKI